MNSLCALKQHILKKYFADYFAIILGIGGSLASLLSLQTAFEKLNSDGRLAVAFLGFFALYFLLLNYWHVAKYRRKIKYSEIFDDVNTAFARLHEVERSTDIDHKEIIRRLHELCDHVSNAFSLLNGHHVGASIKLISNENERGRVFTVARDTKSRQNGRNLINKEGENNFIDNNSSFSFIWFNHENDNIDSSYYYNNNLPMKPGYRNSRLPDNWHDNYLDFRFLRRYYLHKKWPLEYKTTLIVPIIPLISDGGIELDDFRGFLAIDSPEKDAFEKDIDAKILRGLCDGIYNKIDLLYDLLQENPDLLKNQV